MSTLAERLAGLSPAQRQLLEQRLAKARPSAAEPIAIIGMACRFPGAPNLAAYWRLIRECRSAVREVPADRWDVDEFYDPTGETPGKMSVRWAALVEEPDQFDPQFFGITPREAARMDPQQRLLLEVAWEAMENAGLPADRLAGSRTGVFIGIGGTDYTKVCVPYEDYYQYIDAHMGTGNALSIASNRLSYIFDFHGPSVSVDTACSSSSLAVHLAVESLRRGESDAALAGGVNMILTPETTIAFSKARMLSPEGVCRPFDERANGYVRGEGCGLVLLKRLSDAERDGDTIFGVLRASSVNQDGRTSGISAPNSRSQVACIRTALEQAQLSAEDIDYIEAHGTGTPLGDPIEMQALGEIFRGPAAEPALPSSLPPCYVSSVKANVGHMETVSGVAGLIKVVLMMQHEEIVPQTHFETLNPHINLSGTRLTIPTAHVPWPRSDRRRRIAGISSFGFGGTNTHLIVEAPDRHARQAGDSQPPDRPWHLLKLSAKSDTALLQQAEQFANYLQGEPQMALADFCWSANTGRADFAYRAVIAASDREQLQERLKNLAGSEGAPVVGIKRGVDRTLGRPKVAFLFTGQGLQHVGMGRGLFETQPVFRRALERCDEILREVWGGESLLDVMFDEQTANDDPSALLHQTRYTQPALFALEFALAELWKSWGVTPDIVLGHSVGEYAAACVAGVMSMEDGLRLIAERARLMQGVSRQGKMAVVFAPVEEVEKWLADTAGEVVIAVINGPENTVVSGDAAAVDGLVARLEAAGRQVKPLNVSHAFHSPLMEEMLEAFEQFAATIPYHRPQVPIAANLTGQVMTEAPTARYWRDHLRNTVQFAAGMNRVAEAEPAVVIEIGPTASLLGMGRRCVPKLEAAWLPSLRQGQDDWSVICASVSEYYVRGGQIDWRGWDRPWHRRRVLLPTYPFQRSRHWYQLDPSRRRLFAEGTQAAALAGLAPGGKCVHPLLGAKLSTVWSNMLFESALSARSPAYLADHVVQGSPVTPAAAYVEQALAAAEQLFGPGRHGLANLSIQQAMFLREGTRRRVQISLSPESGGESTFEVHSLPADVDQRGAAWTMHAAGSLLHESRNGSGEVLTRIDLENVRRQTTSFTSRDDFYQLMAERGLAYGPSFRVLNDLQRGPTEAIARVELPEPIRREAANYLLHPALGDAMLQSMAGIVPVEADGSFSPFTYMPVGIRRVRVSHAVRDLGQPLLCYAVRTSSGSSPSPERVEGNVYLVTESGDVVVAFEGVQVQRLGRGSGGDAEADTSHWLYRVAWREEPLRMARPESPKEVEKTAALAADTKPRIAPGIAGTWLIFADEHGVGQRLADRFSERGETSVLVKPGAQFHLSEINSTNGQPGQHSTATVDPLNEFDYRQLVEKALLGKQRKCLGVVHLWSLDIADEEAPPAQSAALFQGQAEDKWQRMRRLGCGSALQLLRAISHAALPKTPPVWFVTAGAQAVSLSEGATQPVAALQAPLVGFGRVAALELPHLRVRLVDLEHLAVRQPGDTVTALAYEIVADADEGEIAYRSGKRYVARLIREPLLAATSDAGEGGGLTIPQGPFQLRISRAGSFDALRYVPMDREPPAAGQVEIEIRSTGLNFSDVLKALGLYPGIKDAIVPLGIEASGIVTAVGAGVDRFRVGEEVFGVVPYAFASHARTAEYALVPKPQSISHDQACTIPITFLTAYYALVRLAQLQPGERVLIHAAAGGVGLAAIQIAQHIGAEVFATAGSDAKRDFLRGLGVRHVYSSRSVEFAEEILAATNREGVDVVLNSLPGEAITKSLSLLRAYGRFLEIGKTDIYQNRMIGLLPFQDNLSYFAIDLDRMLRQRPNYIRGLFSEVMRHFELGHYRPLEFTRYGVQDTIDAFRFMSQRKNIGKVVVSITDAKTDASQSTTGHGKSKTGLVRRDGIYLITGGTGALGLRVAEWLADQGAGTIALISRRGMTPEIEEAVRAIRARGANVVVLSADVANADAVTDALRQLTTFGPVRGVVHAAGLLADGVINDMTLEQLDRPIWSKVHGAWNLHTATLEQPLDFFVMFSSVASVLGSPGQANYAAANAFLDALAHARRARGLPAIAINWGPWAGAGMAVENGRKESVKSRGMALIEPQLGVEVLAKLLKSNAPQVAVMDVQWADLLRLLGTRRPALLADIATEIDQTADAATGGNVDSSFLNQLREADPTSRQSLIVEYIRQQLSRIMGIEPESLQTDRPLSTFGLDSLLALELKNNLETRLDFTLPMAKLMEGPSISSLAEEIARLIAGKTSGASQVGESPREASDRSRTKLAGEDWTPLLVLRATGTRPPLVLLPALGGDVRCYGELVERLGDDQPVYAFRPRGADQDLPPHNTMEEMMDDYAAALRRLQPEGPYHLAGWSTGGIFAFALAERLERDGHSVGLVALFDAPLPSICEDVDVDDDAGFLCDLINYANRFSGSQIRFTYDRLSAHSPEDAFRLALAEARRQEVVPPETPEHIIRRLVSVGEANVRVIQGYRPSPLASAPVHLFTPIIKGGLAEVSGRLLEEAADNGWTSRLGQPTELHEVPGDHFTMMMDEGAKKIAAYLSELLQARALCSERT